MATIPKGKSISVEIIGWVRNTEHPMYEDLSIVWRGIARKTDAIKMAIDFVDDLKLRGAWVVKGKGREVIAKLYREKGSVEITTY
jgi:hypothetical protein